MGLKFLARDGHMVTFAAGNTAGQLPRYVGRTFKAGDKPGVAGVFAADVEPVEVAPDSDDATHLARQARKGGIWAADAETAAACGVEFVKLSRDRDGEWIVDAKAKTKSEPKAVA